MPRIHIQNTGKTYEYDAEENLLKVLRNSGEYIDAACGGIGICGKCRIRILSGQTSEITSSEKRLLTEEERHAGIRLACMTRARGDLTVELLSRERKHRILAKGYIPEGFTPDGHADGYGAAVDIGTTTVVLSVVDMRTGEELASASRVNAQKDYGLDVLSRITYEYENGEEGIRTLQNAIVRTLNGMLDDACAEAGLNREQIGHVVIAANCAMTHMLLGVDARSIGRAPFRPVFTDAQTLKCADIGINAADGADLYCLPQVSGYIGGDIVAGAYVCELAQTKGNVLFIDIGTNGEIVLSRGGELLCCSCAAGPALEGMNIRSGMRAAEGAIEDVHLSPERLELKTIGNMPPVGICGSGILAALRELLRSGIVTRHGAFIRYARLPEGDWRKKYIRLDGTKREFVLHENPEILVTQHDVRQVQLAKGAILSGFIVLLRESGIRMEDLDRVIVAGQFGAHLPEDSLIAAGILPEEVRGRIRYAGNTSRTGAYMTLLSDAARKGMEALAGRMHYFELAKADGYEQILMQATEFPPSHGECA